MLLVDFHMNFFEVTVRRKERESPNTKVITKWPYLNSVNTSTRPQSIRTIHTCKILVGCMAFSADVSCCSTIVLHLCVTSNWEDPRHSAQLSVGVHAEQPWNSSKKLSFPFHVPYVLSVDCRCAAAMYVVSLDYKLSACSAHVVHVFACDASHKTWNPKQFCYTGL